MEDISHSGTFKVGHTHLLSHDLQNLNTSANVDRTLFHSEIMKISSLRVYGFMTTYMLPNVSEGQTALLCPTPTPRDKPAIRLSF